MIFLEPVCEISNPDAVLVKDVLFCPVDVSLSSALLSATSRVEFGDELLIPSLPEEVTRITSLPPASTVNVSLVGNPNEVLVSPTWKMDSAIPTLPLNVETPATTRVDVLTLAVSPAPATVLST